ncbi:MAG: hypothetical protein ACQERB_12640 [Promethearchaeati archaeon]
MGESDSYYDWERNLGLSVDSSKKRKPKSYLTKIGVSRTELKHFLTKWQKEHPIEK